MERPPKAAIVTIGRITRFAREGTISKRLIEVADCFTESPQYEDQWACWRAGKFIGYVSDDDLAQHYALVAGKAASRRARGEYSRMDLLKMAIGAIVLGLLAVFIGRG